MLKLYKIVGYIISPLLPLLLFIRQLNGKEDPSRKYEKLGRTEMSRPDGKLIWIHCASVGESNSALALVGELLKDKKLHVLMTTGTLSSASLMVKKLPKRAMHQFNPLDTPQIINKFLNHWQPNSIIWTESEIWPNILSEIKYRNIPCASVNATISKKSFNKWQLHSKTIKEILSTFSVVLAQTEKKSRMLKSLGAKNVKCVGNLKFTVGTPEVNHIKLRELKNVIGDREVVCYSSTHKGEEEIAINIHKNLRKTHKDLLTIILPRHPNRKDEVESLLDRSESSYAFRSEGALPCKDTDIYVADTFGEIGTFYAACPIVFMGGSLSPYHDGGHNPIEPSKFGCAVLSGDKISAFEEIFDDLRGSCKIVKSEQSLQKNISDLLKDNRKVKALSKEALKIAGKDNTILKDVLVELKKARVV